MARCNLILEDLLTHRVGHILACFIFCLSIYAQEISDIGTITARRAIQLFGNSEDFDHFAITFHPFTWTNTVQLTTTNSTLKLMDLTALPASEPIIASVSSVHQDGATSAPVQFRFTIRRGEPPAPSVRTISIRPARTNTPPPMPPQPKSVQSMRMLPPAGMSVDERAANPDHDYTVILYQGDTLPGGSPKEYKDREK